MINKRACHLTEEQNMFGTEYARSMCYLLLSTSNMA